MSYKRSKKFVRPRDQWQVIGVFVLTAGLSVILNSAITVWSLANVAAEMPNDTHFLSGLIPSLVTTNAFVTLALALPLFLLVGLTAVFRIFGPIHRFHLFLRGVEEGTHPEPCRLRERDCLQDLCDQLNRVTEPLRDDAGKVRRSALLEGAARTRTAGCGHCPTQWMPVGNHD